MVSSRSCVKAEDLDEEDWQGIFDYICGEVPSICTAIQGNATLGEYGAYSMCSNSAKLDYVLDAYYVDQDEADSACDFDGQAQIVDAESDSSCEDSLASASSVNDGVATNTGGASGPGQTGDSGSEDEDDDSFGVPGFGIARVLSLGDVSVGLYMLVALGAGVGMVAL